MAVDLSWSDQDFTQFAVDLGQWKPNLHPRDSKGRFRDKWGLSPAAASYVDRLLARFNPPTLGSDKDAESHLLKRKPVRSVEQKAALQRFLTRDGNENVQSTLRANDEPTKDIRALDGMMAPLQDDLIVSRVFGPDAFGLSPEQIDGVEEWTGKRVLDAGFSPTNVGTAYPVAGPHVEMRLLVPRGTKAIVVGDDGGPSEARTVILDREQPIRLGKIQSDGRGGWYVLATVEAARSPGGREPARALGRALPAREKSPAIEATPDELARRGLAPDEGVTPQAQPGRFGEVTPSPGAGQRVLPQQPQPQEGQQVQSIPNPAAGGAVPAPPAKKAARTGPGPAEQIQAEGGQVPVGQGQVVGPETAVTPPEKITPRKSIQAVPEPEARAAAAQARIDKRQAMLDERQARLERAQEQLGKREAAAAERAAKQIDQQQNLIDRLMGQGGAPAAPQPPRGGGGETLGDLTEGQKDDIINRVDSGAISGNGPDDARILGLAEQIRAERGQPAKKVAKKAAVIKKAAPAAEPAAAPTKKAAAAAKRAAAKARPNHIGKQVRGGQLKDLRSGDTVTVPARNGRPATDKTVDFVDEGGTVHFTDDTKFTRDGGSLLVRSQEGMRPSAAAVARERRVKDRAAAGLTATEAIKAVDSGAITKEQGIKNLESKVVDLRKLQLELGNEAPPQLPQVIDGLEKMIGELRGNEVPTPAEAAKATKAAAAVKRAARKAAPEGVPAKKAAAIKKVPSGPDLVDESRHDAANVNQIRQAKTVAQINAIADEHGVRIPATVGRREDRRAFLEKALTQNPGEGETEYQARMAELKSPSTPVKRGRGRPRKEVAAAPAPVAKAVKAPAKAIKKAAPERPVVTRATAVSKMDDADILAEAAKIEGAPQTPRQRAVQRAADRINAREARIAKKASAPAKAARVRKAVPESRPMRARVPTEAVGTPGTVNPSASAIKRGDRIMVTQNADGQWVRTMNKRGAVPLTVDRVERALAGNQSGYVFHGKGDNGEDISTAPVFGQNVFKRAPEAAPAAKVAPAKKVAKARGIKAAPTKAASVDKAVPAESPIEPAPRPVKVTRAAKKAAAAQTVEVPKFTTRNSKEYRPTKLVKTARLVDTKPDGSPLGPNDETTIVPEWGGEQKFRGPYMEVLGGDGKPAYGSALDEWNQNNERVPGTEQGWVKVTPVTAYQHKGEPRAVETVLKDGTKETKNVANDGDWIVRQPNGEVQVVKDSEFRSRYESDAPQSVGAHARFVAKAAKATPAKKAPAKAIKKAAPEKPTITRATPVSKMDDTAILAEAAKIEGAPSTPRERAVARKAGVINARHEREAKKAAAPAKVTKAAPTKKIAAEKAPAKVAARASLDEDEKALGPVLSQVTRAQRTQGIPDDKIVTIPADAKAGMYVYSGGRFNKLVRPRNRPGKGWFTEDGNPQYLGSMPQAQLDSAVRGYNDMARQIEAARKKAPAKAIKKAAVVGQPKLSPAEVIDLQNMDSMPHNSDWSLPTNAAARRRVETLVEKGYLRYLGSGKIEMTPAGRERARSEPLHPKSWEATGKVPANPARKQTVSEAVPEATKAAPEAPVAPERPVKVTRALPRSEAAGSSTPPAAELSPAKREGLIRRVKAAGSQAEAERVLTEAINLDVMRDIAQNNPSLKIDHTAPKPELVRNLAKKMRSVPEFRPLRRAATAEAAVPEAPARRTIIKRAGKRVTAAEARRTSAVEAIRAHGMSGEGAASYDNILRNVQSGEWSPARGRQEAKRASKYWQQQVTSVIDNGRMTDKQKIKRTDALTKISGDYDRLDQALGDSQSIVNVDRHRFEAPAAPTAAKKATRAAKAAVPAKAQPDVEDRMRQRLAERDLAGKKAIKAARPVPRKEGEPADVDLRMIERNNARREAERPVIKRAASKKVTVPEKKATAAKVAKKAAPVKKAAPAKKVAKKAPAPRLGNIPEGVGPVDRIDDIERSLTADEVAEIHGLNEEQARKYWSSRVRGVGHDTAMRGVPRGDQIEALRRPSQEPATPGTRAPGAGGIEALRQPSSALQERTSISRAGAGSKRLTEDEKDAVLARADAAKATDPNWPTTRDEQVLAREAEGIRVGRASTAKAAAAPRRSRGTGEEIKPKKITPAAAKARAERATRYDAAVPDIPGEDGFTLREAKKDLANGEPAASVKRRLLAKAETYRDKARITRETKGDEVLPGESNRLDSIAARYEKAADLAGKRIPAVKKQIKRGAKVPVKDLTDGDVAILNGRKGLFRQPSPRKAFIEFPDGTQEPVRKTRLAQMVRDKDLELLGGEHRPETLEGEAPARVAKAAKKVTVTKAAPARKVGVRAEKKAAPVKKVAAKKVAAKKVAAQKVAAQKEPADKADKFLPPLKDGTRRKSATNLKPGDVVRPPGKGKYAHPAREVDTVEQTGGGRLRVTFKDGTVDSPNPNSAYWMTDTVPESRPMRGRPIPAAETPNVDSPRQIVKDLDAGLITRAEARQRIRAVPKGKLTEERQAVRNIEASPEAPRPRPVITRAKEQIAARRADLRARREGNQAQGVDAMTDARERGIKVNDTEIRRALEADGLDRGPAARRRLESSIVTDRQQANLLDYGTVDAPSGLDPDFVGGASARSRRLRSRAVQRQRAVDLLDERGAPEARPMRRAPAVADEPVVVRKAQPRKGNRALPPRPEVAKAAPAKKAGRPTIVQKATKGSIVEWRTDDGKITKGEIVTIPRKGVATVQWHNGRRETGVDVGAEGLRVRNRRTNEAITPVAPGAPAVKKVAKAAAPRPTAVSKMSDEDVVREATKLSGPPQTVRDRAILRRASAIETKRQREMTRKRETGTATEAEAPIKVFAPKKTAAAAKAAAKATPAAELTPRERNELSRLTPAQRASYNKLSDSEKDTYWRSRLGGMSRGHSDAIKGAKYNSKIEGLLKDLNEAESYDAAYKSLKKYSDDDLRSVYNRGGRSGASYLDREHLESAVVNVNIGEKARAKGTADRKEREARERAVAGLIGDYNDDKIGKPELIDKLREVNSDESKKLADAFDSDTAPDLAPDNRIKVGDRIIGTDGNEHIVASMDHRFGDRVLIDANGKEIWRGPQGRSFITRVTEARRPEPTKTLPSKPVISRRTPRVETIRKNLLAADGPEGRQQILDSMHDDVGLPQWRSLAKKLGVTGTPRTKQDAKDDIARLFDRGHGSVPRKSLKDQLRDADVSMAPKRGRWDYHGADIEGAAGATPDDPEALRTRANKFESDAATSRQLAGMVEANRNDQPDRVQALRDGADEYDKAAKVFRRRADTIDKGRTAANKDRTPAPEPERSMPDVVPSKEESAQPAPTTATTTRGRTKFTPDQVSMLRRLQGAGFLDQDEIDRMSTKEKRDLNRLSAQGMTQRGTVTRHGKKVFRTTVSDEGHQELRKIDQSAPTKKDSGLPGPAKVVAEAVRNPGGDVEAARARLQGRQRLVRTEKAQGQMDLARDLMQTADESNSENFLRVAKQRIEGATPSAGSRDHGAAGMDALKKALGPEKNWDTPEKLDARLRAVLQRRGITVDHRNGDVLSFDPATMDVFEGTRLRPGDEVVVRRPGFTFTDKDGSVVVKPIVGRRPRGGGGSSPLGSPSPRDFTAVGFDDVTYPKRAEMSERDRRDSGIELLRDLRTESGLRNERGILRADSLTRKMRTWELESMAKGLGLENYQGLRQDELRHRVMRNLRQRAGLPEPFGQSLREELEHLPIRELVGRIPAGEKLPTGIHKGEIIDLIIGDGPVGDYHADMPAGIADLRRRVDAGTTDKKFFGGGSMGTVALLDDADGGQLVRKRMATDYFMSGEQQADAEQIMAELGNRTGAPQPDVYRPHARTIYMTRVPGKLAEADTPERRAAAVASPKGRRMAIIDAITSNSDRHDNNWMIEPNGDPKGIDNSLAFSTSRRRGETLRSPDGEILPGEVHSLDSFAAHYPYRTMEIDKESGFGLIGQGKWLDEHPFPKEELLDVRKELVAMKPQFERLQREDWYKETLERLDALIKRARTGDELDAAAPEVRPMRVEQAARPAAGRVRVPGVSSTVVSGHQNLDASDVGPPGDTGREGLPVKDYTLRSGYNIQHGTLYKHDGVTYLIEHQDTPQGKQQARKVQQALAAHHESLPASVRAYGRSYAWVDGSNPEDDLFAQRQGLPAGEFLSEAVSDQTGGTTLYNRSSYGTRGVLGVLDHEFSHTMDNGESRYRRGAASPRWAAAAVADDASRKKLFDVQIPVGTHTGVRFSSVRQSPEAQFPHGVTDYGTANAHEDYAEAFRLHHGGPLGTARLTADGPEEPIWFRDLFPARAAIFDRAMPDFAAQQQAEIAKVRSSSAARRMPAYRRLAQARGGDARHVAFRDLFNPDVQPRPMGAPERTAAERQEIERLIRGESTDTTPHAAIHAGTLTGRVGITDDVHRILTEDTGPQGVPVKDLELQNIHGYKIGSGRAWRFDGVTYLLEDGPKGQDARWLMDRIYSERQGLPPRVKRFQRGFVLLQNDDQGDAYEDAKARMEARRKGLPPPPPSTFKTQAAALGGDVYVFRLQHDNPSESFTVRRLTHGVRHESAHNVDAGIQVNGQNMSESPAWLDAARGKPAVKPYRFTPNDKAPLSPIMFDSDQSSPFVGGVTKYGTTSASEDFAESLAMYLAGVIGRGRMSQQDTEQDIYFRDLFPDRAAVLDALFPDFGREQLQGAGR